MNSKKIYIRKNHRFQRHIGRYGHPDVFKWSWRISINNGNSISSEKGTAHTKWGAIRKAKRLIRRLATSDNEWIEIK